MAMTTAQLTATSMEVVRSEVRPQFYQSKAMWNRFHRVSGQEVGPRGTFIPVYVEPSESHAYLPEGGDLPPAGTDIDVRMQVGYTRYAKAWEFTTDFLTFTKGSSATLLKGLSTRFARYRKDIMQEFCQILYGDGTGTKAVVCDGTATGSVGAAVGASAVSVGTLTSEGWTYGARQLLKRGRYNFIDPATGNIRVAGPNSGICVIQSINQATGRVTFTAAIPTNVVAGDLMVYDTSYGLAPYGLQYQISTGTTNFQGQDRTVYPQLNSIVYDAAGAPLTYGLMIIISQVRVFRVEEDEIDLKKLTILASPTQFAAAQKIFHTLKTYQSSESTLRVDAASVEVNGIKWEKDVWVPEDRVYEVNFDAMARIELQELDQLTVDGQSMWLSISSTTGKARKLTVSGFFIWMGQFISLEPRQNAVLKNLSTTGLLRGYQYWAG